MLHIMGSGNFYGSDMKYENVCEVQGELEGGRNRQDKIRSHFYPKTSFSLLLILLGLSGSFYKSTQDGSVSCQAG